VFNVTFNYIELYIMAVGFSGGGICTRIITFELLQVTDKLYCIKVYQVLFVKDGN